MQRGQHILLCAVIGMCVRVYIESGCEAPSHGSHTVSVCVCVCVCVSVCVNLAAVFHMSTDTSRCCSLYETQTYKKSNTYHEFFGSIPSELHKIILSLLPVMVCGSLIHRCGDIKPLGVL